MSPEKPWRQVEWADIYLETLSPMTEIPKKKLACSVTGMLWTTCGFLQGGMDTVFPDESSQLRGESTINLIHLWTNFMK